MNIGSWSVVCNLNFSKIYIFKFLEQINQKKDYETFTDRLLLIVKHIYFRKVKVTLVYIFVSYKNEKNNVLRLFLGGQKKG